MSLTPENLAQEPDLCPELLEVKGLDFEAEDPTGLGGGRLADQLRATLSSS